MMKQKILPAIVFLFFAVIRTEAQNGSPYWSLSGNSNAAATSKLGTTNSIPLRLMTNNVSRLYIGTDGRLGFGTTAPANQFHVEGNGLNLFVNPAAVSTTSGSGLVGYVRGTPTAAGQRLGYFLTGSLNGGVDPGNGTGMVGYADGAWSTQSRPSYLTFETTKPGSRDRAEAMRVASSGFVGVGTSNPTSRLHVVDSGTAIYAKTLGTYSTGILSEAVYYGMYARGAIAMYGEGTSDGVVGIGQTYGLFGSASSRGVYGQGNVGVYGSSSGSNGEGVIGDASGSAGYGGYFTSSNYIALFSSAYNTSSYAGFFSGNVYSTGNYTGSDKRLKKNITDFTDALAIIKKLKPKSYEFLTDASTDGLNLPEGRHYGLIAQDLETVLPDLVKETPQISPRKDTSVKADIPPTASVKHPNFKAVNYTELIPILIKGMQEQNSKQTAQDEQLQALNSKMQAQETEIQELKKMLLYGNSPGALSSASLDVASPNPAKSNTTIHYNIPAGTASAKLIVVNMSGQVLKEFDLPGATGQVNLNVSNLASGSYPCTLWMNGQPAVSKQLIVAH